MQIIDIQLANYNNNKTVFVGIKAHLYDPPVLLMPEAKGKAIESLNVALKQRHFISQI